MELFLSFLIVIIITIFTTTICLILNIKSYLLIAILIVVIFILVELFINKNNIKYNTGNLFLSHPFPSPNSQPNNKINTITPNTTIPLSSKSTQSSEYHSLSESNNNYEINDLPFDNLEPSKLMKNLQYLYNATTNPIKPISNINVKTHADKYLEQDCSSLSSGDKKLLEFSKAYYPQLSSNGIDTKDCLNFSSSKNSCFQSPQLFHNIKKMNNNNNTNPNPNPTNMLLQGINADNSNLITIEDFANYNPESINPTKRYDPVLFMNAPEGNLDKSLDQQSNEYIEFANNSESLCRNCKLAVCKNDYCGLQNALFM